tara:strand:- start:190 stop:1191 length:1002 start_codon:yes stop_codon:yes gene_type:complete
MGLAVTVQRGHNFSTGEINRAALNNGATPTISITGSVGISELGQNSVNDSKIASGANINVNKLSVPTGNVIVGASGVGSSLAPSASGTDGQEGGVKLLVDTGTANGFEAISTNVSTTSGDVKITRASSGGTRYLSLELAPNAVQGVHLNTDIVDDQTIEISNNKLRLKNASVPIAKLASSSNSQAGFLTFGSGGNVEELTGSSAGKIPVTTANDPVLKVYNKIVPVATSITLNAKMTAEHGVTVASGTTNYPHLVDWYFECTTDNHGYVVGDKVYSQCGFADADNFSSAYIDSTNVGIHINQMPRVPHKASGNSTEPQLTIGSWKVMAIVSEY